MGPLQKTHAGGTHTVSQYMEALTGEKTGSYESSPHKAPEGLIISHEGGRKE